MKIPGYKSEAPTETSIFVCLSDQEVNCCECKGPIQPLTPMLVMCAVDKARYGEGRIFFCGPLCVHNSCVKHSAKTEKSMS